MAVQSCLSRSTAHGLGNIGNEQHLPGRILWLLLTMVMTAGFIFHTILLYNQLKEENVLISTHLDAVAFLQPDIVFCSERFFARDFINHPPEDEYEYMLNVSKTIQRFNRLYEKTLNKSSSLIWDSLDSYQLFRAFFHRKHELFLSIKCNLKDVEVERLQVEMNFVYFACWRLNSSSCRMKSPLDSLIVKFYTHIHGVNITYSALNVMIDKHTIDSYVFSEKEKFDEMEDGIHVYFVEPQEGISEGTNRYTASVNSHTSIKVSSTMYARQSTKKSRCKDVKEYSTVYNLLQEQNHENPLNVTKESLCIEIKFQEYIHRNFHCVLKRFPIPTKIPSNFTFCENLFASPKKFDYITNWRNPNIMDPIIRNCRIEVSCKSVIHTTIVTYNHWPRTSILRDIFKSIPARLNKNRSKNLSSPGLEEAANDFLKNHKSLDSWKRNFIKVSISPAEFMSTVVEESPAYSLKNFFSDTGGIMGFYLGASLLTVCELLRLLHCTITSAVNKKKIDEAVEIHSQNEES